MTDEQEIDLWWGSYSGWALLPDFLASLLITIVIGWLVSKIVPADLQQLAFLTGGGALWLFQITRMALRFFGINYRLTNCRLFRDRGYIGQDRLQVDLKDISEVRVHRRNLERLTGVGRLYVHFNDATRRPLVLEAIAQPHVVAELIGRAAAQARADHEAAKTRKQVAPEPAAVVATASPRN